jgi:hypothetical protein
MEFKFKSNLLNLFAKRKKIGKTFSAQTSSLARFFSWRASQELSTTSI